MSPSGLGIIVNTPNFVFGQEWDLPEETSGESNVDNGSDDEETAEPIVGTSKRRMGARDLTYVYPSRRTISRYLEDASYMNLLMVAEELVNKGDNVVTAGLDDTTKAAGHKFYDVKARGVLTDKWYTGMLKGFEVHFRKFWYIDGGLSSQTQCAQFARLGVF